MKAWVLLALLGAAWSGCLGGDGGNPNLAAPKVVLASRADGNLTIFVHSAFGERAYDWLSLRVDNVSVANRTDAYSLEETLTPGGFFLEVAGQTQGQRYAYRARIDPAPRQPEQVLVAIVDDEGAWSDPRTFNLPLVQILDHARVS